MILDLLKKKNKRVSGSAPVSQQKEELLDKNQVLISKLDVILAEISYNPHLQCPKELIEKYAISRTIASVRKRLTSVPDYTSDVAQIYDILSYLIDSLMLSLEKDYRTTLFLIGEDLTRIADLPLIEANTEKSITPEMLEAKRQKTFGYMQCFVGLIQLAMKLDNLKLAMDDLEKIFYKDYEEFRARITEKCVLSECDRSYSEMCDILDDMESQYIQTLCLREDLNKILEEYCPDELPFPWSTKGMYIDYIPTDFAVDKKLLSHPAINNRYGSNLECLLNRVDDKVSWIHDFRKLLHNNQKKLIKYMEHLQESS